MTTTAPPSRITRQGFRIASRLRRARIFHPRGVTLAGQLHVSGDGPLPVGESDCVVRLSKGFGTPGGAPDVLGVAVRVLTAAPFDVLLASTLGASGWRRVALAPARSWGRLTLSSLMAWSDGHGSRVQVLGEVDDPRLTDTRASTVLAQLPIAVRVRVADADRVHQSGVLVVSGPELPQIDYDPVLFPPAGWWLVPSWLARQRAAAYAGSRSGRPDTADSDDSRALGAVLGEREQG